MVATLSQTNHAGEDRWLEGQVVAAGLEAGQTTAAAASAVASDIHGIAAGIRQQDDHGRDDRSRSDRRAAVDDAAAASSRSKTCSKTGNRKLFGKSTNETQQIKQMKHF